MRATDDPGHTENACFDGKDRWRPGVAALNGYCGYAPVYIKDGAQHNEGGLSAIQIGMRKGQCEVVEQIVEQN
jgi:hypothetical protein